ncbi:hypothetical protein APY94_11045, partial [Thermococcus celericrescens]
GINYTGNGYDDGLRMALWLSSRVGSMNYYVPIPFYKYGSKKPRDNPSKGFNNSYWKDWIDGVLSVVDSNRLGFYWSYESCLQATPNDAAGVSVEFIQKMSNYVHNHGQELIWIPTIGNRDVTYLRKDAFDGILKIGGYFDYVFVQPNYYQNSDCIKEINGTKQTFPYSYDKLVERIQFIHGELTEKIKEQNYHTVVSIEMEADRTVLGIPCGYSGKCPENMACDRNLKTCYENCREHQYEKAINYALNYMRALHDTGWKPSDLAYYFSTDLKVIDALQERCRRELNEPYV